MVLDLLLSLVTIFILLIVTEYLWRSKKIAIEVSRKVVHIGTGALIATWPFYLSWTTIQLLSLALLVVILISYKFNIFSSIHSVDRLTRGEILYPIGIGLCALLEPEPWFFAVAILHLALADGLAAIIGIKYGFKSRYLVFTQTKSVVGSLAFFVTSFLIFSLVALTTNYNPSLSMYIWFAWAALTLMVIENISPYGTDDVTVPVAVIAILAIMPL